MTDIKKHLDPATLGPLRYLIQSGGQSGKGLWTLIRTPKLLLPMLLLSVVWAGLAYLKPMMPTNAAIALLSTLTFAQGGMTAGPVGAVGGVFGKAFMGWFVTSVLAPLVSHKPREKGVVIRLSPAFSIKDGRGFALFLGGAGVAMMLYNFKTGNGSLQNIAVAVAAILAAFRALKRPGSFTVDFIRSFTKGSMTRIKAGHYVVGMIFGYMVAIALTVVMGLTGPYWYLMGLILIAIAIFVAMIFKSKRTVAAAAAVFIFAGTIVSPFMVFAKPGSDLKDPYDAYRVSKGDFEALAKQIRNKPFQMAQLTPVGVTMGVAYAPVDMAPITIRSDESVSLDLKAAAASLDAIHNRTSNNSYLTVEFSGKAVFNYNDSAKNMDHPYGTQLNGNLLPIVIKSAGRYQGAVTDRSDYQNGVQPTRFTCNATEETNTTAFTNYQDAVDSWYSDSEKALYGADMHPGDDAGQLYLLAQIAGGNQLVWNDGTSSDNGMDAMLVLRVDAVSIAIPNGHVQKNNLTWVLEDVLIDDYDGSDYFRGNIENGRIYEESGTSGEAGFSSATYEWTVPPDKIPFGEQLSVPTTMRISWNGAGYTEIAGYFVARAYISANLTGGTDYDEVYEAYFGNNGSTPLHGKQLNPGAYAEGTFDLVQYKDRTGETPFGELTHDNSVLIVDINAFSIGGVKYIYRLASGVSYGDKTPGQGDDDVEDGLIDDLDWGDGWDEEASSEESIPISAAAVLGVLVGAGAAAAGFGGFGGGSGPGNLKIPGGEYDPSDGTLVVTFPGGIQNIYKLNPETGEFESSSGSTLNRDDLERANQDMREDQERAHNESQRVEDRKDGDTQYWEQKKTLNKLREKLEKQARNDNDQIADRLAKHLGKLIDDTFEKGDIDKGQLGKVRNVYGKYINGQIANESTLPGNYTDWQHFKDTLDMTAEEVARGDSNKAMAIRVASAILTAGESEMGFEVAKSYYKTKDYVEKGGDSWSEIVSKMAVDTVIDEGIGRGIGAGIGIASSAGGKILKTAEGLISKTHIGNKAVTSMSNAAKAASDFLSQDIAKTAKSIVGMAPKAASTASTVAKAANAAKAISSSSDDIAKAASQADDIAKRSDDLAKHADDTAKHVEKEADNLAKQVDEGVKPPKSLEKPGKEPPKDPLKDPHEAAEQKWQEVSEKGEQQADDEIQKYRETMKGKESAETAKRNQLFQKGQQIGDQKVANLKRAQDRIKANPNARDAQEAYDEALRQVQQDKYAMGSLKNYKGPDANELRGNFNMRNEQHTQAALQNTRERLAQERGVNPEDIKFVEATNTGAGQRAADASRTAEVVDKNMHTGPNYKGGANADSIQVGSAQIKGAPMDKDVTARIFDKNTKQWIDVPKSDVERVYQQELYKTHHSGQLPQTTIDGKKMVDEKTVSDFAERMDHTVTDRTGADAYGRGDRDMVTALDKTGRNVKEFEDITSVTQTMEYKSNEWFEKADNMRSEALELSSANGSKGQIDRLLRQAEIQQAEGVRQLVKQFDNQVAHQIKAVTAAGKTARVPEKLMRSIKVLDKVGKPGGITVAEAEQILKGMNTSIDDVVQQSSSLMEAIAKFK